MVQGAMELKFELAADSDTLIGSPFYAAALNRLSGQAQRTAECYSEVVIMEHAAQRPCLDKIVFLEEFAGLLGGNS